MMSRPRSTVWSYLVRGILGALVLTSAASVWMSSVGPAWLEDRAVELYQRERGMLAQQGAERISATVSELRRRVSEAELLQMSGISAADSPAQLREALARLEQSWPGPPKVELFVHDAEGHVIAASASLAEGKRVAIESHQHRDKYNQPDAMLRLCHDCFGSDGAASLRIAVGRGRFVSVNINVEALAGKLLGELVASSGGWATLRDEYDRAVLHVGVPRTSGRYVLTAAVPVSENSLPWVVEFGIGRDQVAPTIRSGSRYLLVGSSLLLLFSLLLGGAFFWMERRQHRDELVRFRALAHQGKLATLGTVAAGVGHELRNVLSASFVYTDLIGKKIDASRRGDVEKLRLSLERLRGLCSDLANHARKDDNLDPTTTGLCDLVHSAVRIVDPQWRDRVKFRVDCRAECSSLIVPGAVEQVLINLLLNAAQAGAKETYAEVTCEVDRSDGHARVRVLDRGTGIPAAALPHIFDAFFTTKPEGLGTGLGLWLSCRIIRQQGGELAATNRSGGGAVFEVRLPLAGARVERKVDPDRNVPTEN